MVDLTVCIRNVLFIWSKIVKSFVIQCGCLTGEQFCAYCQWRFSWPAFRWCLCGRACDHLELPLFLHWQVQVVFDDFGPSVVRWGQRGSQSACSPVAVLALLWVGLEWDSLLNGSWKSGVQYFGLKYIAFALRFHLIVSPHSFGCANIRFHMEGNMMWVRAELGNSFSLIECWFLNLEWKPACSFWVSFEYTLHKKLKNN